MNLKRSRMVASITVALSAALMTAGCLTTRSQLRAEEQRRKDEVKVVQEARAQEAARAEEFDEQFRRLSGRFDVVEAQIAQVNSQHSQSQAQQKKQNEDVERRLRIYEESLQKLEQAILALRDEMSAQRKRAEAAAQEAASAAAAKAKEKDRDIFADGKELFDKKEWRQAVVEFQKYRERYPTGRRYAAATFHIGIAFQELNMKDEAKAFFEEVIAKFPKSAEAKKAGQRLKNLK